MIGGDWRIQIYENPANFDLDVFIFQRGNGPGARTVILQADGSEKSYEYGQKNANVKPTFTASRALLSELARSINDFGIALPDQSFVAGELKATKEHLVDLRKLLKLNR